jgi:EAL domain-containing protein (putative c-di-GMP-specific phosphodiesterase class I)
MEDPLRSAAVLAHLRRIGVGLAIDDFGTGYSSLSVLRDLQVDRIKIDRSFVTNLAANEGDLTIVRSVIELGHNLGLRTVAEGVETLDALEILRAIGCDEIQGYLLSVPLSAELVTPILRRGHISLDELRPIGTEP